MWIFWCWIRRRSFAQKTENGWPEEGYKEQCCHFVAYGWESHSEVNCICSHHCSYPSHFLHLLDPTDVACKLVFNLTDATQWVDVYNDLNFCSLYNFITDYFEDTPSPFAERQSENLLKWWNKWALQHGFFVYSADSYFKSSFPSSCFHYIWFSQVPQ